MDYSAYLDEKRLLIDKLLEKFVIKPTGESSRLDEAICYAVNMGGKRLRPILTLAAFDTCSGSDLRIQEVAVAIECIHIYSVIMDDLPCMDNASTRRCMRSCHEVHGEAMTFLAGHSLFCLALKLLSASASEMECSRLKILRIISEIAESVGRDGMAAGQAQDLDTKSKILDKGALLRVYSQKTASLFRLALAAGGIMAGADQSEIDALAFYGEKLGVAFQIIDDIKDSATCGVSSLHPQGLNVPFDGYTLTATRGLKNSQRAGRQILSEAIQALNPFGIKAALLEGIAKLMLSQLET